MTMPVDIRKLVVDFPGVWDDTMRRNFVSCQMKWTYSDLYHAAIAGTNIHLASGGAIAEGFEVARRSFYEKLESPRTAVAKGFKQILKAWHPDMPKDGSQGDKKNMLSVCGAYGSYFERYPLDTDPIRAYMSEEGKCGAEFNFALPIDVTHPVSGQPIIYAGRFDLLGVFNNKLWVVDEKTTSQLGPTWGKQWELRSQFTGYCWGARRHGMPVVGAIVRGISILAGGFGHAEVITQRPDWEVEEWYEGLIREISEAKRIYIELIDRLSTDKYPTKHINLNRADACSAYGGCPYLNVCKARDPLSWIPTNFEYHNWDPVTRTSIDMPYTEYLQRVADAGDV